MDRSLPTDALVDRVQTAVVDLAAEPRHRNEAAMEIGARIASIRV